MTENESISVALEKQCSIYKQMFNVGRRQHVCIENEDYPGLNQSFSEMHQLMELARIGQDRLPNISEISNKYRRYMVRMRAWLEKLQEQRVNTQREAELLLEKSRLDTRHIGQGRKAIRGYRSSNFKTAKFFDGIR